MQILWGGRSARWDQISPPSATGAVALQARFLSLPTISIAESPYKIAIEKPMARPPRIPVWLPLEQTAVYFITLNVQHRLPVLDNLAALHALREVAERLKPRWVFLSAMLMPDHLHLMAMPQERDASVSDLSGALKRWMRQMLRAEWRFQEGCFDHLLRSTESAQAKWEYVRQNPVQAGLVSRPEEWPYQFQVEPEHAVML